MRFKSMMAMSAAAVMAVVTPAQGQDLMSATMPVYQKMMGETLPMLMEATATLAEARGFKEKALELKAQAADMVKGAAKADKDAFEKALQVTSATAQETVTQLQAEAKEMTPEQRKMLIDGSIMFFKGVKSSVEVVQMLPPIGQAIAAVPSSGPMGIMRAAKTLPIAKAVATGIPTMVKSNVQAAKALKDYITANKIQIDQSAMMDFDK